jgi:hypothetical protein
MSPKQNQGSEPGGLRHCLAGCADLHARCVIGNESPALWASRHRYPWRQVVAVIRLTTAVGAPTSERRAAILMRDWGLTDEDISEMLSMPESTVAWVRANVEEVRAREQIPARLEAAVAEVEPDDPDPEELERRKAQVREARGTGRVLSRPGEIQTRDPRTPGLRTFTWNGNSCAFIPTSP